MTGEELIRSMWERWNAGDRDVDDEIWDPEIEIYSVLAGRVFKGEEGLRAWVDEIDEQFDRWAISLDEVREYAPDRFLCDGMIRAQGRLSGVDLDQPASWIIVLRDGRVRTLRNFIGPAAQAEAAKEAVTAA